MSRNYNRRPLDFLGAVGYAVDKEGNVWSRKDFCGGVGKTWRKLRPGKQSSGHLFVCLRINGKGKTFRVHRLVLLAFVGPCPDRMEACHYPDRNPANNRLSNLRWDTHKNNEKDRVKHGTVIKGCAVSWSKLTENQVIEMRRMWVSGRYSIREIGERFGVNPSGTAWNVVTGKSWKHLPMP